MPKRYYCIKQHDKTDCGAAVLATVARQHGMKLTISRIREIAGTDKQGTNVYGIVKAAEEIGFSAKGVKGDKNAFFSEFPLPCIAHVVVDGGLLHYVVVHKITKKKVIIADPGTGIVKLSPEEFFGEGRESEGKPPKYQWTGVLIILVPSATFIKKDESMGIFKRFFYLLIPQKKLVMHVFFASLIYTLLGILGAFYFRYLLDDILPTQLTRTLHVISIGVIILNIFKVLLSAFRSHILLYLSQKLDISLLLGYYNHVISLPMNFFGTRRVGEIISRFNDAGNVKNAITGATLTIMLDSLMVIAGGFILYFQNAYMFFIALLIVALYMLIVWSFNKTYRRLNHKQMEDNALLTSYLVESLNGIQTIKAYNTEHKANVNTERKFITLLKSSFRLSWVSNIQGSLTGFLELTGGVVILWVGAYNVIQGNMTIGQLITFNALLAYFMGPVKNLINLQPMMQTAIAAADRLGEILDLSPEVTENENRKLAPENLKGDICIKNVTFRYGTRKAVLENISMDIKQGEKVALIGESGSGKTTLAKLLLKLYEPEQGDIYIKDQNIKDIQSEVLRGKIAYVPQETFLFTGSIIENLSLGFEDLPFEGIMEAAKMAQAHDFIIDMPLRYETRLEENGANLSGGQRQRLAIARSILKKPDILILDEATSNLDSVTEKALDKTLNEYSSGITTFIIAHRLSTIKKCDKIYVLDKGRIVEAGSHRELYAARGQYYRYVTEQQADDKETENTGLSSTVAG